MKRVIKSAIAALCFFSHTAGAVSVIYGVEKINATYRSLDFPVYVQMGSFSSNTAALKLQKALKSKTSYPVLIYEDHQQHKVRIGPFKSLSAMKAFQADFQNPHAHLQKNESIVVADKKSSKPWHGSWFVNGQAGGQEISTASSATVNNGSGLSSPFNQDIYTVQSTSGATLLGAAAGYRWSLPNAWLSAVSLGLQYQYLFTNTIQGKVIQYGLRPFTNYEYTWQTTNNLLVGNVQFNLMNYRHFSPYLNAGAGGVFRQSKTYIESPIANVTPRISPNYANHSDTQFAYILGAGIEYEWQRYLFSAGYQFSDLGVLRSGRGSSSWSSQYLDFGHMNANAFLFELTYLLD